MFLGILRKSIHTQRKHIREDFSKITEANININWYDYNLQLQFPDLAFSIL